MNPTLKILERLTGAGTNMGFVVSNGPQPSKVPQYGTPFHLTLMMFCHLTKCLQANYNMLREVLGLVSCLEDISSLPASLPTLKAHV